MKIAVPMAGGTVASHFGHCERFALYDVQNGEVRNSAQLTPPPHEPGAFPQWLKQQGVDVVISGGMGRRAQSLFSEQGIEVILGLSGSDPAQLVSRYLEGKLSGGANPCDH